MPVPSLRRFLPALRHEVHPIGRLHEGGLLDAWGAWLPAPGPCLLVLWRPGEQPGFEAARGTLVPHGARWRLEGAQAREAWVVLWLPEGAPGTAGQAF